MSILQYYKHLLFVAFLFDAIDGINKIAKIWDHEYNFQISFTISN